MVINNFQYYLDRSLVKKQSSNPEESKALLEKAKKRLKYIQNQKITSEQAAFIFEDAYEVLREAAQSLMAIQGFKPYSHEATISFIKEKSSSDFTEEDIYTFDRFRQLRNNAVYSAAPVEEEDVKDCILYAEKMIVIIERITHADNLL
ncbi:HEPN domain-containing protein [Candidatus Woesearchaeota archaeon]|nr:HEPN domain-containing protein [Candidatus Woesearchaeota archaeon]